VSSYEFSNFETGIIVKPSVIDRDDYLKSEFQIKGVNSIKASVNRELSKKLTRKIKSEIRHKNSDLIITVNFKDDSYEVYSKPLFIYGRYIKKSRILTQKRYNCTNCFGKGCHSCNFHGLQNFNSVDGNITKFLIDKFDCQQVKINWIGGEEKSSLVLGNGRPFFAKIINPKKRKRILRTKMKLDGIQLLELRKIKAQPKGQISFKSRIEITIKTHDHIKDRILTGLEKLDMPLQIQINGKKNTLKNIYKIKFKKMTPKLLKVNMYADGGIPIKSLVQRYNLHHNFTRLLQNECECVQFDFKKIDVLS
jgi:tRNA pseudouridine synthase 10